MSAPRTPPKDVAERNRIASDLERSYVVEAGAGTGKTTLIVRRILEHVKRGDSLDSLIATTFTEKAASELKDRVRTELDRALAIERDPEIASRWLAARQKVDSAAIQTIHGLCTTLLRERPVEAGLDPGFDVLDAARAAELEIEAFEGTLEDIAVDSEAGTSLAEVLASGVSLAVARSLCVRRIHDRDLACGSDPAPRPDVFQTFRAISTELRALWERVSGSVLDIDDKLYSRLSQLVELMVGFATLDSAALERELARVATRTTDKFGNKGKWKPGTALADARAGLALVFAAIDDFKAAIRDWRASILLGLAQRCVERYESAKRARGVIDFHDQLVLTRNLLRDCVDVRRALAKELRSLIVDEFQDTDPLQAEIAFFLAEDLGSEPATDWLKVQIGAGRLVLVGDPKQSIYRFRRADIEVYELAKERVVACGGGLERIVVNFRCAPGIIAFVNQRFSQLIQPDQDLARIQPEYITLEEPPEPAGNRIAVAVLSQPTAIEFASVEESRLAESRAVAGFLERLVRGESPFGVVDRESKQKRPASFGDCAILFRTLDAIDCYEAALKGLGIPYRVAGGKRYFSRAEVKAAIALFRALDDATDELALLAVLRGPLFTISDAELLEFAAAGGEFDDVETTLPHAPKVLRAALERIVRLRGRRREVSPSSFVSEAYAETRALEIFSFLPEGPQRVANLEKLLTLARSLEAERELTFRSFVEVASRMTRERERQAEAEYLDDDESAVALLTMHSAKGLEWPIVVLADPGYAPTDRDAFVLERGPPARFEFGFGGKDDRSAATRGFEQAKERESLRATAERRRLFYVAATRARDLLVLPTFEKARGKSSKSKDAEVKRSFADDLRDDPAFCGEPTTFAKTVDLSQLKQPVDDHEPLRLKLDLEGAAPAESLATIAERAAFLTAKRERWAQAALACGRAGEERSESRESRSEAQRGPGVPTARGSDFGTLVHRVLERADLGASQSPGRAAFALIASELGADDAAIDAAHALLAAQWSSPLFVELRAAKRVWREVPFVFAEGGELNEGAIDLLAEMADGRLWVVDWKTDAVDATSVDSRFADYLPQGERYRHAVEVATRRRVDRVCFHFLRPGISRDA